jgi:hypothetical protein
MAERGLLSGSRGEGSGSLREVGGGEEVGEEEVGEEEVGEEEVGEEEVGEEEVGEEEVGEEEVGEEEEKEEECLTERQTRTITNLLSESSSRPVSLPMCRPPTPERSPPGFVGERFWELRVNQDLSLERRVCTLEELLVRIVKGRGTSHV